MNEGTARDHRQAAAIIAAFKEPVHVDVTAALPVEEIDPRWLAIFAFVPPKASVVWPVTAKPVPPVDSDDAVTMNPFAVWENDAVVTEVAADALCLLNPVGVLETIKASSTEYIASAVGANVELVNVRVIVMPVVPEGTRAEKIVANGPAPSVIWSTIVAETPLIVAEESVPLQNPDTALAETIILRDANPAVVPILADDVVVVDPELPATTKLTNVSTGGPTVPDTPPGPGNISPPASCAPACPHSKAHSARAIPSRFIGSPSHSVSAKRPA